MVAAVAKEMHRSWAISTEAADGLRCWSMKSVAVRAFAAFIRLLWDVMTARYLDQAVNVLKVV